MRISAIKSYLVEDGWRNLHFVKVETDEGLAGWGEASMRNKHHGVAGTLRDYERLLVGQDPARIEYLYWLMTHGTTWSDGAVNMTAVSGIEQALWDLRGKTLGVPVYEMLGGAFRSRVRAYANGWFRGAQSPEQFAERAREAVALGYNALKWDPFGKAYRLLSTAQLRGAVACMAAVREAVGPDVDLLIECHGRFDPHAAIRIAAELEPYRPFFFEEPVPPENIEAMAEVKAGIRLPLATGERLIGRFGFRELLDRRAADIIQPDVQHAGGILETRKIAAMAEAYYVTVAIHNSGGPLGTVASVHVDATLPNFLIQEHVISHQPWVADLVQPPPRVADGFFELPAGPGLGVEVNEEALLAHPGREADSLLFDRATEAWGW